jgi:hypothetical protein
MRLVVKQNSQTLNEFRFSGGPVYIGRGASSQVLLPDRAVSRQHAVVFVGSGGKWMVEDLDSANKTYLNDRAVRRAEIKSGDHLRISGFTIEIYLDEDAAAEKPIDPGDTLTTAVRKPQVIVRKPDAEHAPEVRMPSKRIKDFLEATEAICRADGPDEVLQALLIVGFRQFGANRVWCALRNQPKGPMTSHAGKGRDGKPVDLGDIELGEKVGRAIDEGRFLLVPQVPAGERKQGPQSAIIAPIMDPSGCFGVLYVDNSKGDESYTPSDLDYLMLLAIHTAAIVENF